MTKLAVTIESIPFEIVFVEENKLVPNLIRWFRRMQEGQGDVECPNHIGLRRGKLVVESKFVGLRISDYTSIKGSAYRYRPTFTTDEQNEKVWEEAVKMVGTFQGWYGYLKIPAFALDSIFHTYWFTQHLGLKYFKVCSQFIAYLFYKYADYKPWSNWRSQNPDMMEDHCKTNRKDWLRVRLNNTKIS